MLNGTHTKVNCYFNSALNSHPPPRKEGAPPIRPTTQPPRHDCPLSIMPSPPPPPVGPSAELLQLFAHSVGKAPPPPPPPPPPSPWHCKWLPDGDSQIFRSYAFGPLGFLRRAPICYAANLATLALHVVIIDLVSFLPFLLFFSPSLRPSSQREQTTHAAHV